MMIDPPDRPFALHVEQHLATAVVVAELGLEKRRQVLHEVDLGLLDVLHAPEDVLAGLFVFGLLGAQLLLHAEVLLLRLLHLGERGVVGEPARLELLAGGLCQSVSCDVSSSGVTYLVLLHLHQRALEAL
jgi:hypothetical protein